MAQTRSVVECPITGSPKELNVNTIVLPTREDVLRHYNWIRLQKENEGLYKPKVGDICEEIAIKLEQIWTKASIPVLHRVRIIHLIKKEHEKLRKLMKSYSGRKCTVIMQSKLQQFKEEAKILFDIAACKCTDYKLCFCEKSRKVPEQERQFLSDQRTARLMAIGSVDLQTSKQLQKRDERKIKDQALLKARIAKVQESKLCIEPLLTSEEYVSSENDDDEFLEKFEDISSTQESGISESLPSTSSTTPQTRVKLSTFARTCDRYGIADRPAAALASALMHDISRISDDKGESDSQIIVDRSKVRRERSKLRNNLQKKVMETDIKLEGLYFDGRKDKTLVIEKTADESLHRRCKVEEHISIIQEPGSVYLGHISPTSGSAQAIKDTLWEFLTDRKIDLSKLVVVGCDGTNVNTGTTNGVICKLEKLLGRSLQWVICQLHSNELPLRHLIEHLDGKTSGPEGFSGPIGKRLMKCESLPIVDFELIEGNFPTLENEVIESLSTDQKYLWDISKAVSSGEYSSNLLSRSPGKLSHARWLTVANRILRTYISTTDPSSNLKELATFIVKVYAPAWFNIKCNPSIKAAPVNLFRTISFSRYLSNDLKHIVDTTIQRNGYFAHPENLLLAMLTDERKHIRELAMRRILSIRSKRLESSLRKFSIPTINFNAKDYVDLINWQKCAVTEPPLTKYLSDEDFQKCIKDSSVLPLIYHFPCHTQAVERIVRLVTEASLDVCGNLARDGFIRARILDRTIMPKFETKSEYKSTI